MDRNNILAFVLISIVVGAYMFYTGINKQPVTLKNQSVATQTDKLVTTPLADKSTNLTKVNSAPDSDFVNDKFGKFFSKFYTRNEELVYVETDLYKATITSKGAAILKFELKNFKKWSGYQTQLINDPNGEFSMSFFTLDGKKIDSRELTFEFEPNTNKNVVLKGKDTFTLKARLKLAENKEIVRTIKFVGNEYILDHNIDLVNLDDVLPQRGYNLAWNNGLRYQEHNSVDESSEAKAMTSRGGELEELKADEDKKKESTQTGKVDFTAVKIKYFMAAIIPTNFDGTTDLSGTREHHVDKGLVEKYEMSYRVPYRGGVQNNNFKTYIGPLEYETVNSYGLGRTINFGWWITRYIGEYFMMPIFNFLHKFIPNFGITIIIFSIFMKFLLYPLSISQMKSVSKMKLLQPEMDKLRAKHKDDQAASQKATMALYSEYGINPMGGCLPLLLQMPILYSLWAVLRTNIELRQSSFIWWMSDLSAPDVIVNFGFSFLGITAISGLSLLMGITMFFQQRQSITDPSQKGMMYIMPVMFTFMFSSFPAGLNLYYFMFNVWSIAHQYWINNHSSSTLTLAEMKAAPKKEGWFQKKMKEAQMLAENQGKIAPKGGNNQQRNLNKTRKK